MLACAGAWTLSHSAAAQELTSEPVVRAEVQAPLDTAIGLRADGPVGKVVVSQPDTIQVGSFGPDGLYVIGSQPGPANLLVYDRNGRLTQSVDVQVGYDANALRELLAQALPGEAITVKALSSSLMLEGEVSSPSVAKIAETLAERIAPDAVISRLHARESQVLLQVRIMEVSTRGLRDINLAVALANGPELAVNIGSGPLGIDAPHGVVQVHGGSGRFTVDAAVRALEEKGQLRVVAQPELAAMSGETASFHAGGEFPFPVPTDDSKVTIEFRPYGAAMKFTPLVQENGLIRLALDTELSALDPSVSLRLAGLTVPGLKVRQATTTAELRDGETMLIAGLFEESSEELSREPPFIARIPLLGRLVEPLIKAVRKQESRRELAIVITPHIGGQAASPRGEQSLLAAVEPEMAQNPSPQRTPKSVAAPRGPPVRAFLAGVRDTLLRPPAKLISLAAAGFSSVFLGRA